MIANLTEKASKDVAICWITSSNASSHPNNLETLRKIVFHNNSDSQGQGRPLIGLT